VDFAVHSVGAVKLSKSFGVYFTRQLPRRLRTRRKSNPRKPKLSPRPRSTIRLFSSLTSTCRAANSTPPYNAVRSDFPSTV
jgi:hypothetical protein